MTILPNAYEPGRATIVVYNWDGSATQAVDLTGVVSPGAAYEIRNAQNFYGPPVVSGTYAGGTVTLPMTGLTPATPVGYGASALPGPAFSAFVVLPAGGTFVATRVLPVIVDAAGQKGAHFSTEITLCNRGVTPASISLTYTASPQFGGPSGTVTDEPAAGQAARDSGCHFLSEKSRAAARRRESGRLPEGDLYGTLQSGGELRGGADHFSFGVGARGYGLRVSAAGRRIRRQGDRVRPERERPRAVQPGAREPGLLGQHHAGADGLLRETPTDGPRR